MKRSAKTLLQKADLVLSDLNSNGGLLNNQQSTTFIRKVLDQPTILRSIRSVPMASHTMKLDKIGFGSRILKPAVENTALSSGDRSEPTFSQVTLSTDEVIAEVRIPYAVVEDNIERGNILDTILDLIGERVAVDLEELALLGDTGSGDSFLALQDGFLKLMTTNVADGTGYGITANLFNATIKALPTKYLRNKPSMRFFVPWDTEQDYRNAVAARGTSLGDDILTGNRPLPVFGIPMVGNATLPNSSPAATKAFLTNPQNLIFGIWRNITVESEKLISERQYKFVVTARVGVAIEEEEATVKITNIGV